MVCGNFGSDQVDVGKSAAADQGHDAKSDASRDMGNEGDGPKS